MPDDPQPTPTLLILCRDLLMGSKITSAAQSAGVTYRVVRDVAKLNDLAGERLIVDLNQEGALNAAAAWKQAAGRDVIGFVSHVDTDTIKQARSRGLDRVIPRSQFVREVSDIVKVSNK